jgi:pimeloyl-ACP methyl ester carboxylesterase
MNRRPFNLLAMIEMPRAMMELASLGPSLPALHAVPAGDGHPVLVLPGFLGSDMNTSLLRRYLDLKGYRTSGWGLGTNLGLSRIGGFPVLLEKLEQFFEKSGQREVSLVGWSLGGNFARHLAREVPEKVRQVICLGSPINDPSQASTYSTYERLNSAENARDALDQYQARNRAPMPVPSTAIFSKTDGVVPHHFAQEKYSDQSENIEVMGSHSGLVVNPQVFCVVGKKLAQKNWQRLGTS